MAVFMFATVGSAEATTDFTSELDGVLLELDGGLLELDALLDSLEPPQPWIISAAVSAEKVKMDFVDLFVFIMS